MGVKHEWKGIIRKKQRQLSWNIYPPLPLSCMLQHRCQIQAGTDKVFLGEYIHPLNCQLILFFVTVWRILYTLSLGALLYFLTTTGQLLGRGWSNHCNLEEHYCSNSWAPVSEERKRVGRLDSSPEKISAFFPTDFLLRCLHCYYNDYLV